jgi:hypothetical protein
MANAWGNSWGGDTGAWLTAWGSAAAVPLVLCSGNTVGSELDSATNQTDALGQKIGDGAFTALSQSFLSGTGWIVGGVCVKIIRLGAPTGSISIGIRAHTGTYGTSSEPTGTDLIATLNYDISAVNGLAWERYWLPFTANYALSDDTLYTLVMDGSNISGDASNCIIWGMDDVDVHAGNLATFDGLTWSAQSNTDFEFSLYGAQSASAVVSCSSATGTLHDEFVQNGDNQNYPSNTEPYLSQSWQSGPDPREVSGICIRAYKTGSPTGSFTVAVRAHTGTYGSSSEPAGANLVASAAFDVTGLGVNPINANNYFAALSGWTPSASTNYTLVVDMSGVVSDGSNRMNVVVDTLADATHSGNAAISVDGTTWTSVSSVDLAFKVYYVGEPVTEDPLTSIDFGTRAVVTISNTLSADETDALKVDVSQLSPEEGTGRPVREVCIEQIKAITSGVDVDILWDATSPEHCLSISGNSGIDWDFRAVGPLTNNAGAGKTGNILFSTNGATTGSSYSVTLVMRKKY